MSEVDNTSRILYHYLRALHVKVSKMTVRQLLDNPLGNSMRGISDALDALHINNGVYQLPKEYINRLETPCIAITTDNKSPFCIIEKIEEKHITITIPFDQHMNVSKQQFLQKWTGGVLISEITEATIQEKNYWLRNLAEWSRQYQLLLIGIAAISLILFGNEGNTSNGMFYYLFTLYAGIFVSSSILYKETINSNFLHNFCHFGEIIDCNKVLHSKGAQIKGVRLGELSLFYFSTLFLFVLIRPYDFYCICLICSTIAFGFTIYSVFYQLCRIKKGCIFCIITNLIVWNSCIALYLLKDHSIKALSIPSIASIITISCICFIIVMHIRKLAEKNSEREQLKNRFEGLLQPKVFQALIALESQIENMPEHHIVLHNNAIGKNELLIITNPNCKACAKMDSQIQKISKEFPVSLLLLNFPGDIKGIQVSQAIIAIYLKKGWEEAMQLLSLWYDTQHINDIEYTDEVKDIWKEQQLYCLQQQINETPCAILDKHYIPYLYQISDLKYVLT